MNKDQDIYMFPKLIEFHIHKEKKTSFANYK